MARTRHVEIAGGFEELLAPGEGLAAVAGHGQAGKEHARAFAQLLGGGRHLLGAFFAAQKHVGVAGQLFKADVADREAEVT